MTYSSKVIPDIAKRLPHFAKLILAIVLVQMIFWLFINPNFISVAPDSVTKIAIEKFEFAKIETPDPAGLQNARFKSNKPTLEMFEKGYYATRSTFTLNSIPAKGLGLLNTNSGDNINLYINGQLLVSQGSMDRDKPTYHGLRKKVLQIPPSVLTRGENRIDSVIVFGLSRFAMTPPPVIGEYAAMEAAYAWYSYLKTEARIISIVVGLVVSLFLAIALLRSNKKEFLAWLFLLSLGWTLHSLFFRWADMPFHGEYRALFYALVTFSLSACWPLFVHAWSARPLRYFSTAMLFLFLIGVANICYWLIIDQSINAFTHTESVLDQFGLVFIAATLFRLIWHFIKIQEETRYWEAALLILLASLMAFFLFNTLIYDHHTPYLVLSQPLFLLAFVAIIFARNFRLFQSSGQIAALLQTQLDDRTAELAVAHTREKQLVRKQAHDEERQRIMRDMHDGLGSHLMSMLMMAKRGKAKHDEYAVGLQLVIDEMRLMIDSMDSVGESLSAALAIFKKRVIPRAKNAGFNIGWNNEAEAAMPDFTPRDVLQVFRILQEAVTNALKHSGGDEIDIAIMPHEGEDYALRILVTDNGVGLSDPRKRGRGLNNMRNRAKGISADLDVTDNGSGVEVRLDLPLKAGTVA